MRVWEKEHLHHRLACQVCVRVSEWVRGSERVRRERERDISTIAWPARMCVCVCVGGGGWVGGWVGTRERVCVCVCIRGVLHCPFLSERTRERECVCVFVRFKAGADSS